MELIWVQKICKRGECLYPFYQRFLALVVSRSLLFRFFARFYFSLFHALPAFPLPFSPSRLFFLCWHVAWVHFCAFLIARCQFHYELFVGGQWSFVAGWELGGRRCWGPFVPGSWLLQVLLFLFHCVICVLGFFGRTKSEGGRKERFLFVLCAFDAYLGFLFIFHMHFYFVQTCFVYLLLFFL